MYYSSSSSTFVPSFIPWKCVYDDNHPDSLNGSCASCGVHRLLPDVNICPLYNEWNHSRFEVMVWSREKIQNSSSEQYELRQKTVTYRELVDGFVMALQKARRHYVDYTWGDHAIRRLKERVDPNCGETIATDFAATVNLRARLADKIAVLTDMQSCKFFRCSETTEKYRF